MIEQGYVPHCRSTRIGLCFNGDQRDAGLGLEDQAALQCAEAWAERAAGAQDVGVIASHDVVLGARVDEVIPVMTVRHVVAADDVVVLAATGDEVTSLTTDDDVFTRVTADQVAATVMRILSIDRRPDERMDVAVEDE